MINIKVNGAKVECSVKGMVVEVCAEVLTAIDTLRDNLAELMEINRRTATEMIIESLQATLLVEE